MGDGNSGNILPIHHTYTEYGIYNVCMIIYTACATIDTCFEVAVNNPNTIHPINPSLQKDIYVYPNPATNTLYIHNQGTHYNYTIYNSIGQSVLAGNFPGNQSSIDISSLVPGNYLVLIQNNEQYATLKFSKR